MNFRNIYDLDDLIKKAERNIEDVIEYFMANFNEDVELTDCRGHFSPGRPATREDPPEFDEIEIEFSGFLESKLLKDDLNILINHYSSEAESSVAKTTELKLSDNSKKYESPFEKQKNKANYSLVYGDDIEGKKIASVTLFLMDIMNEDDTSKEITDMVRSAIVRECKVSNLNDHRNKYGNDDFENDYEDDYDPYEFYDPGWSGDLLEEEARNVVKDIKSNPIKIVVFELVDESNYLVKWEI